MNGPFRPPRERFRLAWEAVAELCTARQALVLRMRHVEGMTYTQIAARLGCSEKTVRRDLDEAHRALGPRVEVKQ